MSPMPSHDAVDVVPFAARCAWTDPFTCEIWWEDPRDVYTVVVRTRPDAVAPSLLRIDYWQSTWPHIRLPRGELVGAGSAGWLAIDDWVNGRWQAADGVIDGAAGDISARFRPLNRLEFPAETDFPAEFRRTLKLRLLFDPAAAPAQEAVAQVLACTDSVWRELEVVIQSCVVEGEDGWSGRLEVYNGSLLRLQPYSGQVAVDGDAWRASVAAGPVAGIVAHVRYAHHDDSNSYDRTLVTLRAGERTFTFAVDDLLAGEPIYVRDFGALATTAAAAVPLADFAAAWQAAGQRTLRQRIAALPEQTWEGAWAGMPAKRRRMYYVIGCEGGRQKFGVEPNGDVFLTENFLRAAPGRDTPRLGFAGHRLTLSFGLPAVEPGDRSLLDGYLPAIHTVWTDVHLCYEQEACATWLGGDAAGEGLPAGDEPVVALLKFRITNLGDDPATAHLRLASAVDGAAPESLAVHDGLVYAVTPEGERLRCLFDTSGAGSLQPGAGGLLYDVALSPHGSHTLFAKVPHLALDRPQELARLRSLDYDAERARVADYWRGRIAAGAQIETPNETLNRFYRAHLAHMLVVNDRLPGADCNIARCGGFVYGSFPDEGCMVISDLDRRGYTAEAARCLDLYVRYQGTAPLPGAYARTEGVFYGSGGYEVAGYNRNQGWVLWCLAEHYRYTRDRAWLERVAPALVKGCDWVIGERQATRRLDEAGARPLNYGFLPAGSLEDVTDYWTWLSTNAYAYWGLRAAAAVLVEIGHAEAPRLERAAALYGQELRAGFFAAAARSPVVRLRDGTWAPHFPPRQERRGRDFGWLREVLEGAAHLIYCGLIDPTEPAARWIIDDYEDNLFLGAGYGYPAPDFERQWFGWGGFSMQPNLLLFPPLYLWRDEPEHFLRSYFNPFASAFYPDTVNLTEHALPKLADWLGDHFKTSDEANSTSWLRLMFLAERGNELFVGRAIPRAWFADGQRMRVTRALTHFGEASLEIISQVATGHVTVRLDPPRRNPPERILLRVRHPNRQPMAAVWVNGVPHADFDGEREIINLGRPAGSLEVRVRYADAGFAAERRG